MKIRTIEVVATAFQASQIIKDSLPKIVFIGRSNVGKSSLINTLLGRKKVARTSNRPGKTISLNYYKLNGNFYFVDLPGYGYARISHEEKERTSRLITTFFEQSQSIKAIVMLIDSRFGFMQSDIEVLHQIRNYTELDPMNDYPSLNELAPKKKKNKSIPILTILTKSDKINFSKSKQQQQIIQNQFQFSAIPFSIKTRIGIEEVWVYLDKVL